MSHMVSTDITELHTMAGMIGVSREWFQGHPRHPHYDVCKKKKRLAIQLGALEVSDKELIKLINQ